MGVQLNIKDAETIRLARELAGASGLSITETIREALRKEQHARKTRTDALVGELAQVVRSARGNWKSEFDHVELSTAHGDILYDENGLSA